MFRQIALVTTIFMIGATQTLAAEVSISATRDNTLYEPTAPDDWVSNGDGDHFFSGFTSFASVRRRAVIGFDIASQIPPGATITSATLTLYMSRTNIDSPTANVEMRRLTADWGEAGSDATDQEGIGAPPDTDDATWRHRFFDTADWGTDGGDFSATVSATTAVGDEGSYSWTGPQLAADIQDMLDNPANDFGWLLLGDETQNLTAKRFDSRTNPDETRRPVLTIEFDGGVPTVSEWGLIAMTGLLLAGGGVVISRRRTAAA